MGSEVLGNKEFKISEFLEVPAQAEEPKNQSLSKQKFILSDFMGPLAGKMSPRVGSGERATGVNLEEAATGRLRTTREMEGMERYSQVSPSDVGGLGNVGELTWLMLTTPDDDEKAAILKGKDFVEDVYRDKKDNWVVQYKGEDKPRALNKPAFSVSDALNIGLETGKGAVGSKYASGAKTTARMIWRGFLAGGGQAGTEELLQGAQGGYVDPEMMLMGAGFGMLGEAAGAGFSRVFGKLNPVEQMRVANAKTLNEIVEVTGDRASAKEWKRVLEQELKTSETFGFKPAKFSQIAASSDGIGWNTPLEQAFEAAGYTNAYANRVARERILQTSGRRGALENIFSFAGDPEAPLTGATKTAAQIMKSAELKKSKLATDAYTKAFVGALPVDSTRMVSSIRGIAKSAPLDSPARKKLEGLTKQFYSDDYIPMSDALASRIQNVIGSADPLMQELGDKSKRQLQALATAAKAGDADQFISLNPDVVDILKRVGIKESEIPTNAISAEKLQQIGWSLDDIINENPSVKHKGGSVAAKIKEELDRTTGDRFSKVDDYFAELQEDWKALQKSKIGKAGEQVEDEMASTLSSVFNPSAEASNVARSKRFFNSLRAANPQAAEDLYNYYYSQKIQRLGKDATASDLLKSVFGSDEGTANMVTELAGGRDAKRRLKLLRNSLEHVARLDKAPTPAQGARASTKRMEPNTLVSRLARWLTISQTGKQVARERGIAKNMAVFMDAFNSDKYAKRLDEILSMPPSKDEQLKAAEGLFERIAAEYAGRPTFRDEISTGIGGTLQELTRQSANENLDISEE